MQIKLWTVATDYDGDLNTEVYKTEQEALNQANLAQESGHNFTMDEFSIDFPIWLVSCVTPDTDPVIELATLDADEAEKTADKLCAGFAKDLEVAFDDEDTFDEDSLPDNGYVVTIHTV